MAHQKEKEMVISDACRRVRSTRQTGLKEKYGAQKHVKKKKKKLRHTPYPPDSCTMNLANIIKKRELQKGANEVDNFGSVDLYGKKHAASDSGTLQYSGKTAEATGRRGEKGG